MPSVQRYDGEVYANVSATFNISSKFQFCVPFRYFVHAIWVMGLVSKSHEFNVDRDSTDSPPPESPCIWI